MEKWKNGKMEKCILYPDQYNLIYKMTYMTLFTMLYGLYNTHNILSIFLFLAFLSSSNYWRYPIYCWRRTIDIYCVNSVLIYHLICAINAQYAKQYYIIVITGSLCYPLSWYFYNKKYYWISTYFHCMLHIMTNISLIRLYTGEIGPVNVFYNPNNRNRLEYH